jgi:membrane-bound ClpP family serine protease
MIIEPQEAEAYHWDADSLVGRIGITIGELVPSGDIEVDGRRWDATSRVGVIPNGTQVKVIAEEMGQLYVIPFDANRPVPPPRPTSTNKESLLDRPAEDFGIDQLE